MLASSAGLWCHAPMRALVLVLLTGCASAAPLPSGPSSQPAAAAAKAPARSGGGVLPVTLSGASGAAPPLDPCPRTPHAFRQPVAITEDLGIERWPPVVRFPMAFPRGADLRSLVGFVAATPDGALLPTQVEVLSRWGDGPVTCEAPIRWAYAYALADAPPKERAFLALEHEPTRTPEPGVGLAVLEEEARVVIDTGPARFTLNKATFDGLARVELRGEDGGWREVAATPKEGEHGLLVLEQDRLASPRHGRLLSFEVERAGPVVATVAVKGTYAHRGQGQLFRYTLRLHFYAGTGTVQLDHTFYNGATENMTASGAQNVLASDRVFLRLPLAAPASEVVARAARRAHRVQPAAVVSVEQYKRSPERPNPTFAVSHGQESLELGTFADEPMLAVTAGGAQVVATLGLMGPRDPQALRFDPARSALEIDWQSEAMAIGGARGIWSVAVLDFTLAGQVAPEVRGTQLYAHASRPVIGAPNPTYLNGTHAYGLLPDRALKGPYAKFDEDVDRLHDNTVKYLRKYRITGTQMWPDLPRSSCTLDGSCPRLEEGFFEGGDCNYWDWSLPELEQFLRTADPSFVHDFALGEAITMAETISFRPDWYTQANESSFGGLSPCYGSSRGWGDTWTEGLNHRSGNCPGDYGYNKVHRLAYILSGDRRFTDFFQQGADTAVRIYGEKPRDPPPPWLELSASRQTAQYLEPLLTAAEFGRDGGDQRNRRYRDIALTYFDFLEARTLARGHSCTLLGSGFADPKKKGECMTVSQWMMPVMVDWVQRLYLLYEHPPAKRWLLDFVRQSTRQTTVPNGDGFPDVRAERAASGKNTENGWRNAYQCKVDRKKGILDETCTKITDWENANYYYGNGLVAYLNALALVAEVDPKDSLGLCRWLPEAYAYALRRMDRVELNDYVWGKSPGQAYAFSQRALGAILRCP